MDSRHTVCLDLDLDLDGDLDRDLDLDLDRDLDLDLDLPLEYIKSSNLSFLVFFNYILSIFNDKNREKYLSFSSPIWIAI